MNWFVEYLRLNQSFASQLFIIRTQWLFITANILLRTLTTVHEVGHMLKLSFFTRFLDQKKNLDQCNSQAKPDSYGHYREVQFSQIKLHWAWKLNFIRQKLAKNELSFKYIVLLEEDHFLLPDALHIAKNHILPKVEECPDNELCLGLLGIYPKTFKLISKNDGITKSLWISGKHNMGMIVTLKWIDNLVKNHQLFCNHDDYNWDFSLMKVSQGKVINGQMRL